MLIHIRSIRWFLTGLATIFIVAGIAHLTYAQTGTDTPASKTVITFGADADQEKPQPLWDTILSVKPDLFLFLGDNVYLDTTDENIMRSKYAKLGSMPGYLKLLATRIPIMATWDDHDYGEDDAGANFEGKEISKEVFLDFFREPKNSPRRSRGGIYDSKIFGEKGKRIQVIALDLRYFRSANGVDDEATMLGAEQWQWLTNELKKPAEVRVIMSSIQVVSRDNGWENWMNVPLERAKLFKTIRDTGANGVLFVSGDRHFAELSQMDGNIGYPIYDLTTGSINKAPEKATAEKNLYRTGEQKSSESFGLISIEWGATGQTTWITLEARDIKNQPIIHRRFPLIQLSQGVLPLRSSL